MHADQIKTPTLFLGGEKDFNVPLVGGEQMYQALRSLGVPTQLVVYPGQFHGITRPSYQKDRMERYLAWYAKYLKARIRRRRRRARGSSNRSLTVAAVSVAALTSVAALIGASRL